MNNTSKEPINRLKILLLILLSVAPSSYSSTCPSKIDEDEHLNLTAENFDFSALGSIPSLEDLLSEKNDDADYSETEHRHAAPSAYAAAMASKRHVASQPKQKKRRKTNSHSWTTKKYVCDFDSCKYKTYKKSDMTIHQRTHSNQKPFKCDECSKSFSDQRNFRRHVDIHVGKKPFTCNECSASFTRKNHLVIHQYTHRGEKPFKCTICNYGFAQSNDFKRHQRTQNHIAKLAALTQEIENE
ncbi:C2H2-type zinc finger protein [Candidatus Dependentiae bacterium]|nr:C2H2-type zinc finger protein [Candidatus Dependentiae bacterium]